MMDALSGSTSHDSSVYSGSFGNRGDDFSSFGSLAKQLYTALNQLEGKRGRCIFRRWPAETGLTD